MLLFVGSRPQSSVFPKLRLTQDGDEGPLLFWEHPTLRVLPPLPPNKDLPDIKIGRY